MSTWTPDYGYAVRAYRRDPSGRRRGLLPETASLAIEQAAGEGRLRAIQGDSQTDFVPVGIDKGVGLRALVAALEPSTSVSQVPVALAVGDTVSDLPLLACARLGLAPAHADAAVQRAGARRHQTVPGRLRPGGWQAAGPRARPLSDLSAARADVRGPTPPRRARRSRRLGPGLVRSGLRLALTATTLSLHRRAPRPSNRADSKKGS